MNALLAALERGRTHTRRRVSTLVGALAVLLVSAGALRVARGNRFVCTVPKDRVAAAWSTDSADPRRQAIHRAFAASGRATFETSWERVSKVLDEYMHGWSSMYLQTCEATHVRGEQSGEVLDLRMSCLNDNLDQVHALTETLVTGDSTVVSRAVIATMDLTPISRCSDIALLRSAVPLPKDEHTSRDVRRLRGKLAEIQAKLDLGDAGAALKRSDAIRSEVEATEYKPLLGELLSLRAIAEEDLNEDPALSEAAAREAIIVAQAAGESVTSAKVASGLAYVTGYRLGRLQDAEFWAAIGNAVLDRIGGEQKRVRAWLATDLGAARIRAGDFEGARVLEEKAVHLKREVLGENHPDVAVSLSGLAYALTNGGHPAEALVAADRAVDVLLKYGDPESFALGYTLSNQGDALNALGRYSDAKKAFEEALRILVNNVGPAHPERACALHGLGETRLAQGDPRAAIPLFQEALRIRQRPYADPALRADSEFGFARALTNAGGDRRQALALAKAALRTYQNERRPQRQHAVEAWLNKHHGRGASRP